MRRVLRRLAGPFPRRAAGAPPDRPATSPGRRAGPRGVELLAERLLARPPQDGGPVVALVVDRAAPALVAALAEAVPGARVVPVLRSRSHELHLDLVAAGPYDGILDMAGGQRWRRFGDLLLQLRAGGTIVTARPDRGEGDPVDFPARLRRDWRSGPHPMPRPETRGGSHGGPAGDRAALLAALADLEVRPRWVVAVNGVHALAKVPDASFNRLLERRPSLGRVLATVPGQSFASLATVRSSEPERLAELPRRYDAPELSLREYADVTCAPMMVAYRDNVLLPDTFRYNARRRLHTSAVADLGPRFALRPDVDPAPLEGRFFLLDSQFRGHFGHALAEQVSHLWGWWRAREDDPAIRPLMSVERHGPLAGWERLLWSAADIDPEEIELIEAPVRVERLVAASPMLSEPQFVHPGIKETYDRLGAALAARSGPGPWPRRLFLSRRIRKRACTNTPEVEKAFSDAGFDIVYPEEHPLPDQVRMFREAEVIGGFAGSGMFHMAFTGTPKHIIQVASEAYHRQNEHLMASVVGHRVDIVVAGLSPDPTGRRKPKDVDFTYDPAREGVFLRSVLDAL